MKTIFISYANNDADLSNLLIGQATYNKIDFEFVGIHKDIESDMEAESNNRKLINECNGVLAIVTANTHLDDNQLFEIMCATKDGVPILAIWGNDKHKNVDIPSGLSQSKMREWAWSSIVEWLNKL